MNEINRIKTEYEEVIFDDEDYTYYRYGEHNWKVLLGNSIEEVYFYEDIESKYQSLKKQLNKELPEGDGIGRRYRKTPF